jgi:hypothetical protein
MVTVPSAREVTTPFSTVAFVLSELDQTTSPVKFSFVAVSVNVSYKSIDAIVLSRVMLGVTGSVEGPGC